MAAKHRITVGWGENWAMVQTPHGRARVTVVRWEPVGDRDEPVEITVRSEDPGRPLTSRELRSLPFGEVVEEVRYARASAGGAAEVVVTGHQATESDTASAGEARLRYAEEQARLRRGRAKAKAQRYDRQHWEDVAAVYRKARQEGKPPRAEISEAFGVSATTAKGWAQKARRVLGPDLEGD